jgi:hypothetical protein
MAYGVRMKKIIILILIMMPSISTAKWFDTKTNTYYETQAEACTAAAGWYCSTYGWGGCGYDGIVDVNAPGSYPWYRDCQVYRTTPNYSTYNSQINGYPLCDDPQLTANNDYDCLEPKDCADKYNDLDLLTEGIQCTCPGGFPPTSLDGGITATCDGVRQNCDVMEQKQIFTDGNVEYAVCQPIEICDPVTDPNQCQPNFEPYCDFDNDGNQDDCEGQEIEVGQEANPICPTGYVYNSVQKKCHPVETKEKIIDESSGTTTTKTTVNEGDTTTTIENTTTNEGDTISGGGSTGEGEQENREASGGDTCDSPPVCSGDAINCAQLNQAWIARCEITKPTDLDLGELDQDLRALIDDSPLDGGTFDFSNAIDTTIFNPTQGTNQCPEPIAFQVMGLDFEFEHTAFCDLAETIRPLVLLSGILGSIYILFVYKRKQ